MKKQFLFLLFLLIHLSLPAQDTPNYALLPTPSNLLPREGYFPITPKTTFQKNRLYASFFQRFILEQKNIITKTSKKKNKTGTIAYELDASLAEEAYTLDINPDRILIRGGSAKGFFYADQTLIQLLRLNSSNDKGQRVPALQIQDAPRFSWRGMHLDESRHFFGKTFVKEYLDQLAALKMNVFHWHLSDAPGWRIEIKKYPKLTSVGAWRPDRSGLLYGDADTAKIGEPMTYGGFYTQADIREIVAYATERHITMLPEIEMPGHTTAALVAYPEFSCSGGPFPMPGGAKNSPYPNYCVGNPATMQFLQDILSEIMDLFPSTYIHIGGDEVEREQWKTCKRCQKRKTELGLADEASLQVDFTKRIEDFIRSKGRQLMGWDEIMEGGNLTPSAGVMVWRGENLVREATAAGHEVVIAHNYYFDLYQGNPQYEPVTYGYKPISEVYNYEPVPADLTPAQQRLVHGVEGCLWSENLYSTRDAEYMLFPRLYALAEVAWTPAPRKNYNDFAQRLPMRLKWLSQQKINYATAIYNPYPQIRFDSLSRNLICRLEQQIPQGDIRYTFDGTAPTLRSELYTRPLALSKAAVLKAAAFKDEQGISKTVSLEFKPSLACGKPFTLKYLPQPKYNGKRPEALTDGISGSNDFHDGNWCGFYGDDLDLRIDLQTVHKLKSVYLNLLEANGSWIYLPLALRIEVSEDGQLFETVYEANTAQLAALSPKRIKPVEVALNGKKARFVRVYAENPGQHPVYGDGKCWLMVDEVGVGE